MTTASTIKTRTIKDCREWLGLDPKYKEVIQLSYESFPSKVSKIAKSLPVKILRSKLPPRISGEIRRVSQEPESYEVRINRFDSKSRQRFTAAHELAHFFLHRNLLDRPVVDTVLYRSRLSTAREAEANRLAANILMPTEEVKRYLVQHGGLRTEEDVLHMASHFGVSDMALKFRLGIR